ncbi:hypothetical protein U1Q18_007634 [Sarracenia purpurea var. burkii]
MGLDGGRGAEEQAAGERAWAAEEMAWAAGEKAWAARNLRVGEWNDEELCGSEIEGGSNLEMEGKKGSGRVR